MAIITKALMTSVGSNFSDNPRIPHLEILFTKTRDKEETILSTRPKIFTKTKIIMITDLEEYNKRKMTSTRPKIVMME